MSKKIKKQMTESEIRNQIILMNIHKDIRELYKKNKISLRSLRAIDAWRACEAMPHVNFIITISFKTFKGRFQVSKIDDVDQLVLTWIRSASRSKRYSFIKVGTISTDDDTNQKNLPALSKKACEIVQELINNDKRLTAICDITTTEEILKLEKEKAEKERLRRLEVMKNLTHNIQGMSYSEMMPILDTDWNSVLDEE